MNCKEIRERMIEAEDAGTGEEARELERHLAGCFECRQWQQQLRALTEAYPVVEPDANLVARSRQRLDAALDALPPLRWYDRLGQQLSRSWAGLEAVPVAAGLLLALGTGAGWLGSSALAWHHAPLPAAQTVTPSALAAKLEPKPVSAAELSTPPQIASIDSIVHQPNSPRVVVRYNQMVPRQVEGSLDDPAIRQLLMQASQNSASAGVRGDSVGLMAAECRGGHRCPPAGLRDALLAALRHDRSAGVRAKALQGLEPYVAEDMRVRDAVLQALMNDSDPQIRNQAINILEPVEADTSVRQVLHSVADTDRNPYIRTVSRQVLSQEPEIQ